MVVNQYADSRYCVSIDTNNVRVSYHHEFVHIICYLFLWVGQCTLF